MDSNRFNLLFWKHYMILEEDFIHTERYVDLNDNNYGTFSVEYTKLLQSIGSEFDVICREICGFYGFDNKKNIRDYGTAIIPKFTNIENQIVIIRNDNSIKIKSLNDWVLLPKYNSPKWWKAYNEILKIPAVSSMLFEIENWKAKQEVYMGGKLLFSEDDE